MTHEESVLASLHEAGHAVAILAQGGKVDRVTMDHCVETEDSPLDRWQAAVVSMAGAQAARALGPRHRSDARRVSEQDKAVALHHLAEAGIPSWKLIQAEEQARALVTRNDRSVQRVAQALRQAGTLSGAQVAKIHAGEDVAGVLAQAGETSPTPRATARLSPIPFRVEVESWELRAGGWCASPARGQGGNLTDLDAVGPSKAEAEDALRALLSGMAGRPVAVVAVR